jgi:hypothetical protein
MSKDCHAQGQGQGQPSPVSVLDIHHSIEFGGIGLALQGCKKEGKNSITHLLFCIASISVCV